VHLNVPAPRRSHRLGSRPRRAAGTVVAGAILFASASTDSLWAGSGAKQGRQVRTNSGKSASIPTAIPALRDAVRIADRGWWVIESGPVRFGDLVPGEGRDLPGAVRVRVYSAGSWTLKLVPQTSLRVLDRGSSIVPTSRLFWRSSGSGGYRPIPANAEVTIARGDTTRTTGETVIVDLRMVLDSNDDLGRYGIDFRVVLETH